MSDLYQFVVSIPGKGARVSLDFWPSYKVAEKQGWKWAESQDWLKDESYTVSHKLLGD